MTDIREDIPHGRKTRQLPELEVLSGVFRSHVFPRHTHDGLMLSLIDQGAQKVTHKGTSHIGAPGRIVAMAPNEAHSGEPAAKDGWRYRSMTVSSCLLSQLTGLSANRFDSDILIEDAELSDGMSRVFNRLDTASPLELEAHLSAVLETFATRYARPVWRPVRVGQEDRAVEQARDYLAAHPHANVTMEDLSQAVGLDSFRLSRAFSARLGLPPHAWHLQHRLRLAQARLAAGEPVSHVAYDLGFSDQAHLTRLFKRLTGITPARYRQAHSA